MENSKTPSFALTEAERERLRKLAALNTRFYAAVASSFSETRKSKWPGWDRLVEFLLDERPFDDEADGYSLPSAFSVLDVACGNMRFESYLQEKFPASRLHFCAIDNCASLANDGAAVGAGDAADVRFVERDVLQTVMSCDGSLGRGLPSGFDMTVCFGFFHHILSQDLRFALLRELVELLDGGGVCCISLWRFADDERLAKKAEIATKAAIDQGIVFADDLREGDYLLGWQERSDVFRCCHSFSDDEVRALVDSVADTAELALEYRADGKSADLNTYLVFSRHRVRQRRN